MPDHVRFYTARLQFKFTSATATAAAIVDKIASVLITKIMRQKRALTTERYKHAEEQQILDALNTLKTD